jgi:hypothetical protein
MPKGCAFSPEVASKAQNKKRSKQWGICPGKRRFMVEVFSSDFGH